MLSIEPRRDGTMTDQGAVAPGHDLIAGLDSLDDAGLDQFLADQTAKAPEGWASWSPSTKRAWLKVQVESAADAGPLARSTGGVAEHFAFTPASAKVGSRVSLMTSLAALANPIEGRVVEGEGPEKLGLVSLGASSLAAWAPNEVATAGSAGELEQPDALRRLVSEIDNLSEQDARDLVGKLAHQGEATFFRLGGILARLKAKGWRRSYGSFKRFVEAEHGIPYRQASHWMAVYRHLAESNVAWNKVQAVGWTKLKEIAGVVTPENVDEWVRIALENKPPQLIALVASAKATGGAPAIAQQTGDVVTRMTFRVHADQKGAIQAAIDKAKTESGAQSGAALETICANYVSGTTFNHEAKTMGLEACLRVVEEAYPNAKLKVVFVENDSQVA